MIEILDKIIVTLIALGIGSFLLLKIKQSLFTDLMDDILAIIVTLCVISAPTLFIIRIWLP